MTNKQKSFSSNNKLSYYTDKGNIPNQDLVRETIEYFKNGEGARAFRPLELLNLLDKQFNFVKANFKQSDRVISHLKALPFTELEKHILLGLIIKWFGGYPFNEGTDFDESWLATKKVIQNEFLSYPDETPEKEFCRADIDRRNHLMKLGLALTASINSGIPAADILNEISEKGSNENLNYSFEGLFNEAVHCGLIVIDAVYPKNITIVTKYHYLYNVWLQKNKDWEYGNEKQYRTFLSIEIFKEFLNEYREKESANTFYNSLTGDEAYQIYQQSFEKLRERFRVKSKVTKEDCRNNPGLREGDIISFEPEYKSSIEAFTLLTEYYSIGYFELQKYSFFEKYKAWNELTIRAEISEIEKFIKGANNESLSDASRAYNKWRDDKEEYVYLRLKSGFYKNLEIENYPLISTIGNREAMIYGKYFLFYEFLKQELGKALAPQQAETKTEQENKPTIAAYAIMHVYLAMFSGQAITQQNKNDLAKKYGYGNGDQLRNDFTKFQDESKRLDLHTTNKSSANTHLKRFKDILPLLKKENTEAFERASEDLRILENTYSKHY